jgi:DNA-directed RNA polymerase
MKRFDNFDKNPYLTEFKTYLPIQLDGTCNGFQHLALLSNESHLFDSLNLLKANKNEDPKDFYEHIVNHVIVHLENKKNSVKVKDEIKTYDRLLKLGLNRSNVKSVIMTKPYNAKDKTLANYIKDTLIYSHKDTIISKNYANESVKSYIN